MTDTMTHGELVIALLLIGQYRIDPIAVRATERPAAEAAAALAAGEPQRAGRRLGGSAGDPGGDPAGDTEAAVLGYAAAVLDQQWTPRGAGSALAGDALEALVAAGRRLTADDRESPLGVLATTVLPELLVASAMSADERRSGLAGLAGLTRRRLAAVVADWPPLGPAARSYAMLALADLSYRDGEHDLAAGLLGEARLLAGGDAAAQAQLALTRGDWFTGPQGYPDTLGLAFGPAAVTGEPAPSDDQVGRAGECYDAAELLWSAIGSRSGVAAVAMRRAHLARRGGLDDTRDEELARARRLATESGDGGLAALVEVHRLADAVARGERVEPEAIDGVRRWSQQDGSRSYARGLVDLLAVRSRRWRDEGEFTPARQTWALARRLAGPGGYRHDGASVSIDLASLYGGAGYRRARFVLADLELGEALTSDRTRSAVEWARLGVRGVELSSEAHAQADPDLLAAAARRIQAVTELPMTFDADESELVLAVHQQLTDTLLGVPGSAAWYEAQRLRDAGAEAAALTAFGEALDKSGHDLLLQCAVLASVPVPSRALELARLLEPSLPPLLAARLYLRLSEPEEAGRLIEPVDPDVQPPWTYPALLAALHRLLHRPADQARHAGHAVQLFEQRQNTLARDVLRSAATDDWTVAEAYRDLVTGLLADGQPIEALAAADRARGLSAVLLADLAGLPQAARQAVRDWLAANSRWAAAFEAETGDRASLDEAESGLDQAETRVREVAPALLAKRVDVPVDLGRSIDGLPPGTVLLAYHHFRGEVTAWALTGDGTVETDGPVEARDLTGAVGQWQRALSRGSTDTEAAERLAEVLLGPFRGLLERHRRVVVVPHRELSLVPFHALPWAGGVLGDHHDVSVLPAVALLDRPGAGRRVDFARGVVLLGDPETRPGPARLPGTRCEVLGACRHLDQADVLLGAKATLAGLRPLAAGRGAVHLAAHAVVRPGRPHRSHVLLAGGDRLEVADLLGSGMSGDLLVLSACQTGEGTPTLAGDVSGLARAALIAGFAHLVVTLWPIQDQVAAVVMERFYAHLAGSGDVSRALAEAQREVARLSAEQLLEAYAALPGAEPDRSAPMRDMDALDHSAPDPMSGWAAFTHVGAPALRPSPKER
jgi:CHAT domain-containing protein